MPDMFHVYDDFTKNIYVFCVHVDNKYIDIN